MQTSRDQLRPPTLADGLGADHGSLVAVFGAVVLALLGQILLQRGQLLIGAALLVIAASTTALFVRYRPQPALHIHILPEVPLQRWRLGLGAVALLSAAVAFFFSTGNRYQLNNVLPWVISVVCWLAATLDGSLLSSRRWQLLPHVLWQRRVEITLLLAILALGAVFRFVALYDNPRDMNSDQAEKLLDVIDVLNGTAYIFFERNTGREPWQFYWTVALIQAFDLAPDFMALKLGTALIGWLMLPAVFLLARELFDWRVALLATLFAAVASWGVITARFGLRYPLAPCATAWTLFFLIRGLRRGSRNAFLLAGLWAGIGLQGYTAYRFMLVVGPLLVASWLVYLVVQRQGLLVRRTWCNAALAAVLTLLVLVPLLRYGVEQPDQLFYRAATRLAEAERPIEGEPLLVFVDNVRRVLLMFNVTTDEVWVANLPDRPAMDLALGALLVVGAAAAVAISLRTRNPWPFFVLCCGLLFLLPSALSLAFPAENPSVVRTGCALPLLMIVCALVPGSILDMVQRRFRSIVAVLGSVAVLGLCLLIVGFNWQRVFVDYPAQYCPRAQNASDIADEMQAWAAKGNDMRNAWIVGFPHWVDTRAVGVWLGDINFPNTMMGAESLHLIDLRGQPGLFVMNINDVAMHETLKASFPQGRERIVEGSLCAGREFVVFETLP
ncbi:glycosyltransferase family 39 protein [Candidatus Gracilibacteria bacterium]|nr:glycosyltransferase family 39 protein [Candidatus Gracilibacteria bacterium]